jgi:hypothetical protein
MMLSVTNWMWGWSGMVGDVTGVCNKITSPMLTQLFPSQSCKKLTRTDRHKAFQPNEAKFGPLEELLGKALNPRRNSGLARCQAEPGHSTAKIRLQKMKKLNCNCHRQASDPQRRNCAAREKGGALGLGIG